MKPKTLTTIMVLLTGGAALWTMHYLLAPGLALPGETSVGLKVTEENVKMALTATIASLIILLGIGVASLFTLPKLWREKGKFAAIIFGLCNAAMVYTTTIAGLNLLAWNQEKTPVLWTQTVQYTPEEIEAGRTYLKTIKEDIAAEEFQKTLSPLLQKEKWGFVADDPTLYLIGGLPGKADSKRPKWEYVVPLGNAKAKSDEILKLAKDGLQNGNPEEAAERIAFVIGLGNRVTTPQTLIQSLIGTHITQKGIKFLEENPEVPMTENLQREIQRITKNQGVIQKAYQEEFKIMKLQLEKISKINGTPTPYACLTNPKSLDQREEDWFRTARTENADWNKFMDRQKMHAFLTVGPIQAILIGLSTPGTDAMKEEANLQKRTKSLLQGESRSNLTGRQKLQ